MNNQFYKKRACKKTMGVVKMDNVIFFAIVEYLALLNNQIANSLVYSTDENKVNDYLDLFKKRMQKSVGSKIIISTKKSASLEAAKNDCGKIDHILNLDD